MRRTQFNVRTTYLSDEAYEYVEKLSKDKILSYRFAQWAEKELRQTSQSSNEDFKKVLQEIENLKSWLVHQIHSNVLSEGTIMSHTFIEKSEPIQQLSTDHAAGLLDDEDKNYDY